MDRSNSFRGRNRYSQTPGSRGLDYNLAPCPRLRQAAGNRYQHREDRSRQFLREGRMPSGYNLAPCPQPVVAADKGPDYNLGLDFRAFVNTDFSPGKSCSCHFTVNLQWSSGNGGGYVLPATFMTLVHDDETYNCVMK